MKTFSTTLWAAMGAALILQTAAGTQIFVEAEQFAERGGWVNDSQFMDLMGSPFLLAHGMGRPVADAVTTVDVPEDGTYAVYARTRNWTAPWTTHAAGVFRLAVDGVELENDLGTGTGDWRWQQAGTVTLKKGAAKLALRDKTGFDGRCDAVCLTTDGKPQRPSVKKAVKEVQADLVVCGGGIAGTCAAISAARLGLNVALVQDRPMLGGANSSEVRVHLGGFMNLGPYPRLGDVVAEIGPAKGGNARPAANYEDQRKLDVVAAEKNIHLYLNTRVTGVEALKPNGAIQAVVGVDTVSGAVTRFSAPLFADCTGDATVGALAGADFRMGRESKSETGEEMAPEEGDRMTMGASVQWYTRETQEDSAFPARPWMIAFNEQNCEHGIRGDWDWETGMNRDQVYEFERIRDYGMLVVYSNWSFLKNASAKKAKYARREFEWVAFVAGKRESRRLQGDHVLTQQDVFDFRPYPDASFATTWAIDLHYPMPSNKKNYPGEPFRSVCTHNRHYAYPVPYRCLYSRNVPNLFMAGRNISVTHVALGTVRVMRTTGMMGEVVGMAARVCRTHGCGPRGVYESHLDELKALMTKGVGTGKPQPPQDYNRGSLIPGVPKPPAALDALALSKEEKCFHPLSGFARAVCFASAEGRDRGPLAVYLRNAGPEAREVTVKGFGVDLPESLAGGSDRAQYGVATVKVPAGFTGWIDLPFGAAPRGGYTWIVAYPAKDVSWGVADATTKQGRRAWKNGDAWRHVDGEQYLVRPASATR